MVESLGRRNKLIIQTLAATFCGRNFENHLEMSI